jgi:hypothetical protein
MTGHFTSYKHQTNHELTTATRAWFDYFRPFTYFNESITAMVTGALGSGLN